MLQSNCYCKIIEVHPCTLKMVVKKKKNLKKKSKKKIFFIEAIQ